MDSKVTDYHARACGRQFSSPVRKGVFGQVQVGEIGTAAPQQSSK